MVLGEIRLNGRRNNNREAAATFWSSGVVVIDRDGVGVCCADGLCKRICCQPLSCYNNTGSIAYFKVIIARSRIDRNFDFSIKSTTE